MENFLKESLKKVRDSYFISEDAHGGQVRESGEEYFKGHPVKVADLIFKKWQEDKKWEKINSEIAKKIEMAAYLHDTVEDTKVKLEDIEENFGEEIKMVIDSLSENGEERKKAEEMGVSKNEVKIKMLEDSLRKIEALKNSGYSDAWEIAATVRIADILNNISDIWNLDEEHRTRNLEKARIIFKEFSGKIDLAESLGERIEEIEIEKAEKEKGEKKTI